MSKQTKDLAALIVEDVESDAQLIARLLKKAGYELTYEQVETAEQMRAALTKRTWDIVISDYSLPQFDGRAALMLLKETGQDIPFIVVSGTMGEETAVAMMKAGAHDYLVKGNLARLLPAVERELDQAGIRRERRTAEDALRESEDRYRRLAEHAPDIIFRYDVLPTLKLAYINQAIHSITGYTPLECYADPLLVMNMIHPDDSPLLANYMQSFDPVENTLFARWIGKDGAIRWMESRIALIQDADGNVVAVEGITRDVSARKQAEESLAASEAELRSLVEQTPAIVYTESADTRKTTYISSQVEKVTGCTPAEWIEDRDLWKKIIHPEDREAVVTQDKETTASHDPFHIEYRILTRDGRTVWVHDEAVLIKNQDGTPLFWQGVMYDITERKQAEELARQQSEQLRLLYEASQRLNRTLDLDEIYHAICDFMSIIAPNDGLVISSFDPETQLITCRAFWMENKWLDVAPFPSIPLEAEGKGTQSLVIRSGQSMLINDYQKQMITAQNSYYVNDETNEVVKELPPEEEDITRSALIVPLKSGGLVSGVIQVMSYHLNAYNEDQLKLLEALALHIASAEQNAMLYARMQTELNERKNAEKSLREREEQYRTLVEQLPAIVFIDDANLEGHTLYISPQVETILGFSPQEWLGRSPEIWMTQVHPNDREWVHAGYMRCLLHGEPHDAEYRIKAADGRMIWLRDQAVRLSDENGKPHLIHGVMYDITERKQTEESLRISEERYRELFNGMIDGFALHEIICDANGKPIDYRFLEVNPAFERMTGFQSENLIGRNALEIMPLTEPYWIEVYGSVALTGRTTFYENYSREFDRYFEVSVYCPRPRQFATIVVDITDRKHAEESIRNRVIELEMLYQSGLALNQLLNPKEIGKKILKLLDEKLNWHHTIIRLYNPHDGSLELLAFNQPGLDSDEKTRAVEKYFNSLISKSGDGLSGWVVQHSQTIRSGDVRADPHYVDTHHEIRSGLYTPIKLGERMIGVIGVESEQLDAFSEADERLIVTLANQAASAFENARLFEETRQRVMELETLNRISLVLRAVTKQNEMLSIVLDEALAILKTSHGSIELHNKTTNSLDQVILRGWISKLTAPHPVGEGIAGKVFTSGETYISREFASDPETRIIARAQTPPGWGGVCLPIRTTQQILGVMIVSMPSEHDLNKNEIRLLSILSEMTGAALQRMQLHEQTVHRLEQLNAMRAVDQAISSSRDMRLTLNVLLMHTISQLGVDAASALLLHPGSNTLELVGGRGFHSSLPDSVRLSNSFAVHAIMEHRLISAHDFEVISTNSHFAKLWKEEGFVCYWCVPLIVKGEVKGVLEVYCRTAFTPDSEWLEFLEALAGQAAIAIDNTQLFENLQRANMDLNLAYDATIEGWSRAMDLRDHETEGHTLRVTDLTMKLARAMRVSESQLTAIRRGALLHDIGKMGVPDAILLKEGDLTDEEWVLMRKHPEFARDMLIPITYLNDALNIPYCHHEKWDGTGYPQGLKGEQIPLVARIFAVVDVWDALTNDRTYRKKWAKQQARHYIKEQSCIHFDPQVVDVFLNQVEID